MSSTEAGHPLAGRRIVTTRDVAGPLDERLTALGAEIVHLPLIEIRPPDDGGAALARELTAEPAPDWVIVTSRHGAAALGAHPPIPVLTAAVGRATAAELERAWGRPVDLVPETQHALGLLDAFADRHGDRGPCRILVAQADRAEPTLAEGLRRLGHHVEVVTAYRTVVLTPEPPRRDHALGADAVTFASGSAAVAWSMAIGPRTPPVVCAIGPSTARVARDHGLRVTHVADDHSVDGLVRAVVAALSA